MKLYGYKKTETTDGKSVENVIFLQIQNQDMKTYFIRTYGCQQNERDSEEIETILVNSRLKKASSWRKSDLLVLNSCSVRQASEDKIYGLGREVNLLREKGNNIKVIVYNKEKYNSTNNNKIENNIF